MDNKISAAKHYSNALKLDPLLQEAFSSLINGLLMSEGDLEQLIN